MPVILLDADFDPVIAAKFFWTDVRMVEIPVRQQAEIMQVVDRSCSMRFLLGGKEDDQQRANNRLAEVQRFAGRVMPDGGLFVSYKAALERMTLPAGVDAVHLGNLRGRDGYKHHDVVVTAGRLEPSVEILERMTRCLFGDEAESFTLVQPGERDIRRYPTEQRRYRMVGGGAGPAVDVSVHPDPRAQALLEQVREREIEVTIIRTLHRAPIVDEGPPKPLNVPIQVSGPFHVIDVDEAWALAGHDTQWWTLFDGKRVVLPVAMAAKYPDSKLRCPEHPHIFTRDAA